MSQYKIIFTGPAGAGKTTAIAAISDSPPIKTDAAAAGMTNNQTAGNAFIMDYGVMNLEGDEKIHLYGTAGQGHCDFMRETSISQGLGLILLLDNTRPDPFQDMRFFLETFQKFIEETGVAIGITQMDLNSNHTIADYHAQLKALELNPPVFAVDARKKRDVSLLVQSLIYTLDPGLQE